MSTNIYVGNLSFNVTAEEIQDLFGAYGTVERVNLITDRETGRPRGFGFVEMASGGNEAIRALNEKIATDERVDHVLLPLADGLTMARVR